MRKQKKIKVALTGGIGTGKTYISKQFIDMGIPVFYADEEAKNLYATKEAIIFFKKEYGETFFTNNQFDIIKLSAFIFTNEDNRKQIEAFIHPFVMQQFEDWAARQSSNIVMLESALIFEAEWAKFFDKIIVVDAPLEVRIKRIKKRNPLFTDAEILQRMNSQLSQEEKCKYANLIISNYEEVMG
jgi:dephospho-CoA kinase